MKFSVIINPLSRSVPKGATDELEAAIVASGHDVDELYCSADQLRKNVEAAASSKTDGVIVWGGDGTLACALTTYGMSGPPVLALPGGTMNMLPKRLYGDAPWNEVLETVLSSPETRTIAAGRIEDRQFYIAALFGRLTGLAETREAIRKGALRDAANALVEGEVLDVETRLRLTWLTRGSESGLSEQTISAVAAAVALTSAPDPALEVAAIDPGSTMELFTTALDAMMHGWKQAEPVSHGVSDAVSVHDLGGDEIPATLDGEQVSFTSPVHVELVRKAARVLCPESRP